MAHDKRQILERELAAMTEQRDELRRWTSVNGVIELQRERDEARELHRTALIEREATETAVDAMLERSLKAERERDRLAKVIESASVLIAAKGRHNTMLAYNGLRDALQSLTPNQPKTKGYDLPWIDFAR